MDMACGSPRLDADSHHRSGCGCHSSGNHRRIWRTALLAAVGFRAARHLRPDDVLYAGSDCGFYRPKLAGRAIGKNRAQRCAASAEALLDADWISISAIDSGRSFPPCMDQVGTVGVEPLVNAQNCSCVALSSHPERLVSHGVAALCEPANADQAFRRSAPAEACAMAAPIVDRTVAAGCERLRGSRDSGSE